MIVRDRRFTATSGSSTSIRDAAIKQITYGSGATTGSITNLAGTVDFHYLAPVAHGSWADAYGTNHNCQSAPPVQTTLRCDDPVADGTVQPPTVMSTLTLQTVTSYVGSDTGNKDYSYTFSYAYQSFADTPFSTCYDPYSLAQEYCAGEHLLMSVTPTVYQHNSGTALKGVTFGYSSPLQDTYYDSTHTTQNGSQQYGGQTFWQYLNFYEDLQTGVGEHIRWARAYNNTHGTPTVKSGGVVTATTRSTAPRTRATLIPRCAARGSTPTRTIMPGASRSSPNSRL